MSHAFRSLSVSTRQWATFSGASTLYRLPQLVRTKQLKTLEIRRSFWSKWFGKKDVAATKANPSDSKWRPKLIEVPLKELRFCKKRLGCVNLEWKWVQEGKPRVTDFFVDGKKGPGKAGHDAFYDIMAKIDEQTMGKVKVKELQNATVGVKPAEAKSAAVAGKPAVKAAKRKGKR
ncbi:hypothetical protein ABW19_dt0206383 [Dactylella cylindrospora]|nr:hypothetical protein ABW19_dt0206383 [Dactylella cylindrospora]